MKAPSWRRAVLKVGSALIAPDETGVSTKYLLPIARFINECRERGQEVVIVSSGSVAAGRKHFHFEHKKVPVAVRKAMSAVGQNEMMGYWSRFFDSPCAQLLMTHSDLRDRARYVSIKNTLNRLLEHNILPVVNENDALATDEMKVGDNDNLSAMVATLVDADALFICSDIDGLYDSDPNLNPDAKKIPVVEQIDESIYSLAGGSVSSVGTGGMRTKVEAAEKATSHGIDTYIVNGRKGETFESLLQGDIPGTLFRRQSDPISNKKHWLRHTLVAQGEILVDEGAEKALIENGASLLSSGIVDVQGDFDRGDAVLVRSANDTDAIAKGICQYSAHELMHIKGQQTEDIAEQFGYSPITEVIHRDDLMILEDA
ncbi:glutamate 5-kinase [Idiomarina aminovorans]|uniref:glutamate 5-kinase n=1 Tax=Idiomarina aminovorans TaxID=2914829 RepID=UPI0020042D2C|nr:glutamate 5-kinase [Idiomarina sp. ATCH4]MCK7459353.1 glutamate 5-kinase [Idiomarina sp. ATCH4]